MKQYDERVYAAWLSSPMLPPDILEQLISGYHSAEAIYKAFFSNDQDCIGIIPESYLTVYRKNGTEAAMDYYENLMYVHGIRAILHNHEKYPENLKHIQDPPCVLFYQGNLSCFDCEKKIAVVGSRKASYKGIKAARELALELSKRQICIISGLAYGIDTASHEGCLMGGSPTIAVLGCGLNTVYPAGNAELRKAILNKGGLIISEFTPGERPLGWHFPIRNRIISGLGEALIVMEARKKSGSLTTVQWALDQGKDVFAYPGDPEMRLYNEGNHQLLRDGARFFTRAEDILEDMNWLDNLNQVAQNTTSLPADEKLSAAEKKIIAALAPGALSMDELCLKTGMQTAEIMGAITMLQVKRKIEALPGKYYQMKALGNSK